MSRKPSPEYNLGRGWIYTLPVIENQLSEGDAVCDMHDWCVASLREVWVEAEDISFTAIKPELAETLIRAVREETYTNKSLILIDRTDDYLTFTYVYDGHAAGLVTVTNR